MHGDVAETNHPFEFVGQTHFNQAALGKQGKNVARALWDAQFFPADQVLSDIQCRFTGALNVQDSGILAGKVSGESGWVTVKFLMST